VAHRYGRAIIFTGKYDVGKSNVFDAMLLTLNFRLITLSFTTGDRHEARRHASVLVLAELVRHADVIVYPYVDSIVEHIWVAFRDPNVRKSTPWYGKNYSQISKRWLAHSDLVISSKIFE